ncbi:MAG TPA: UbiA family prenyltransferase [Mycobacteriales bacterium]|nr:UbiA family prenyltransferase [Mycobacteriales bacterium]
MTRAGADRPTGLAGGSVGSTRPAGPAGPVWPGWRPVAELVRLPAVLSVPGDVLVGAASAGWPFGRRTLGLAAASGCLYWAGMALNDWADRDEDAVDRPGRPIPSGRVRPGFALGLASGLTAAGVTLAAVSGGRRALRVAAPLAGTIWAYDLGAKATRAGPLVMAAARGLDVLLGAGGRVSAWPAAGTVAGHIAAVTTLSRVETTGGPAAARAARAALAGTALVTAASLAVARRKSTVDGRLPAGLLAGYPAAVSGAQLAAARDPSPATVQRAVGAGILGLIPLQAGLLAAAGSPRLGGALGTLWPLARRLSRRMSPT